MSSFQPSFERKETHTTQWTRNSLILLNGLCRFMYKTWMESTYDKPIKKKSTFLRDYWTNSDGVFAEMQIISYSFLFLKHRLIYNFESYWLWKSDCNFFFFFWGGDNRYIRFPRSFWSPHHSSTSIFNSVSSGEAYCVQILSSISSNCHSHSSFVNQIKNLSIQICQLSLKVVSTAKWVRKLGSNSSFLGTNSLFCYSNSSSVVGLYIWEMILSETLTKMNANRRNWVCTLPSRVQLFTVTDEFELQLTKTDNVAQNWMTLFQNWLTKDEIQTSIRTFQSVRDEIYFFFMYSN